MNVADWIAKAEELRQWHEEHPRPPRGKYPEIDELMDELDKVAGELSNHIPGRSETMDNKSYEEKVREMTPAEHVEFINEVTEQGKGPSEKEKQVKPECIKQPLTGDDSIVINGVPHLNYRGLLKLAESAGVDTEQLKVRFDRVRVVTLAWLRLGMAADNMDHREAVEAVRDLFKALGAIRCAEVVDRVTGDAVLSFGGVGRKARSLRITVHTDMEG